MKTLKASKEFVVGKHDIIWVGSDFKEHLYDLTFTPAKAEGIQIEKLPRAMIDKEIQAELNPDPITLGDLLGFLKEEANHNAWYLCHVADSKGVLWAVHGRWRGGGWRFEARALDSPGGWRGGHQFLSRRFSVPSEKTLGDFDSLSARVKALEGWRLLVNKSHDPTKAYE